MQGTLTSNPLFLYLEINTICTALLVILLFKAVAGLDRRRSMRLFCAVTACYALCFSCDSLWVISQSRLAFPSFFVMNVSLVLYFSFMAVGSFLWFLYIENEQGGVVTQNRTRETVASIPLMLVLVIVVISPITGFIFRIDENRTYIRGDLYFLIVLCVMLYPAFSSIKAFVKAFSKNNYYKRRFYLTLGGLMLIPAAFSVVQYFAGIDYPVLVVGYAGAVLSVYIEAQEEKITVDKLTGVNTRDEVLRVVSHRLNSKNADANQYLFMIDADKFKSINDDYGHVEGDKALILIAKALKDGMPKDFVIGRFGGDEFIAIGSVHNNVQAMNVCANVEQRLKELGKNKPYDLKVSIGFAKKRKDTLTVPDFIKLADDKLYVIKESKAKENYSE